jgi:hypothetical protein
MPLIKIEARRGLSPETKDVFIVLQEVPVENWGLRGGIAATDIDFGFKIEV